MMEKMNTDYETLRYENENLQEDGKWPNNNHIYCDQIEVTCLRCLHQQKTKYSLISLRTSSRHIAILISVIDQLNAQILVLQ